MSTCNSCGATIVWAIVKESGERIPLDTPPTDDGTLEYVGQRDDPTYGSTPLVRPCPRGSTALPGFEQSMKRYVAHFATCPDADDHRKK